MNATPLLVLLLATVLVLLQVTCTHAQPPKHPPAELLPAYTLQDSIPLERFYVDDSNKGQRTHYSFPEATVASYLESAQRQLEFLQSRYGSEDSPADQDGGAEAADVVVVEEEEAETDAAFASLHKKYWPMFAMSQYRQRFKGARVAVFGSIDPYFETIALALGAASTTTFEYNDLTFRDAEERMHVVCGDEYLQLLEQHQRSQRSLGAVEGQEGQEEQSGGGGSAGADCAAGEGGEKTRAHMGQYDIVLSISSFDHSGLGRYGDALDPAGDVRAMQFAKAIMKRRGRRQGQERQEGQGTGGGHADATAPSLLFLTIPIGPDVIVWNLHRRYGAARLPLLLADFRVVRKWAWSEELLTQPANWRQTYEPVFVLSPE